MTTLYECFVSYCNVPRCNVESPLEHANSSLLCMPFEFSFDTVRSTNDSLKQTTGMLLVCSSCLWFNQLSVPELVQHEQRPQHVFSRNLDSCSEGQHFLKSSKVSQLERTMLSFSLASNTSHSRGLRVLLFSPLYIVRIYKHALEYSNQC